MVCMKYLKLFEDYDEKKELIEVPISKITTERPLELVDTNNPHKIIQSFNNGIMPLDKLRVETMIESLKNGRMLPNITISENFELIDGHHRYYAIKEYYGENHILEVYLK